MMRRNKVVRAVAVMIVVGGVAACQSSEPQPYDGQSLFLGYCASCHGPNGAGDGPMSAHLATRLPDLRTLAARNAGNFPRERIIAMIDGRDVRTVHGSADMPVWGFQFRREEGMTDAGQRNVQARIDALVDHIEALQERSPRG